jgi:hypothetical protein
VREQLAAAEQDGRSKLEHARSETLKFQTLCLEVEQDCEGLRAQLARAGQEKREMATALEVEREEMEEEMLLRVREAEERVRASERWREAERAATAALDRIAPLPRGCRAEGAGGAAAGGDGKDEGGVRVVSEEEMKGVSAAAAAARERARAAIAIDRDRVALEAERAEFREERETERKAKQQARAREQETDRMREWIVVQGREVLQELRAVVAEGAALRAAMEEDLVARVRREESERGAHGLLAEHERKSKALVGRLKGQLREKDDELQQLADELAVTRDAQERERLRERERDRERVRERERESERAREREREQARADAREESRAAEVARLVGSSSICVPRFVYSHSYILTRISSESWALFLAWLFYLYTKIWGLICPLCRPPLYLQASVYTQASFVFIIPRGPTGAGGDGAAAAVEG